MNLGIIGLPQAGKKTVFQILTGLDPDKAPSRGGIAYGLAPVRDPRVDQLREMYQPRRTRFAEFDTALPPDIVPDSARTADWLDPLRQVDAFIHVVRTFESDHVFHLLGEVNPERDVQLVEIELLLADLELVETRLQRIAEDKRKKDARNREREINLLMQLKSHLEDEKSLRTFEIAEEHRGIADNLQLMTRKPLIVVFNGSAELPEEAGRQRWGELADSLAANGATALFLNAKIEREISELNQAEQAEFMAALAIAEPAAHRLSRAAYQALGLLSFFTVGPDEVRAWPLRRGSTAPEAAGRIHTDLQRGFIRAETVGGQELLEAGSEKAAREANLFRLNGKDYVVRDGDVLNIRFNV